MGNSFSQSFPPAAKFTEKDLSDQTGKVFIVTGSSAGVGKELAQILYSHNAKVYVASKSEERAAAAISSIKSNFPNSKGELEFLHLELGDLTSIKKSAETFLSKETRLDVLWNNAGVMIPAQGSKSEQGYELQMGVNVLGPFLFTKFLTPILLQTAKNAPTASVRVVWLSSSAAELLSPKGGVDMTNIDYKKDQSQWQKYGVSKAANILYSTEFAKRYPEIISTSCNPGNLKSDLQRHMVGWQRTILNYTLYTPIHGAYTELFCGISPEVTPAKNGAWIIPWGRFGVVRKDIDDATKSESEGGTGNARKFWEWTEEQVKQYL